MPEVIQIDIGAAGDVNVETRGFVGAGCTAVTKAIEAALGTTTSDVKKPEFHQQAKAHERANATAGAGRS